jgi:hypothetical protein
MDQWIDNFRQLVCDSAPRLLSLPDELTVLPPGPGKWSAKETIGHLIDSAANNHQRFVRAQFKSDLIFQGYDQEQWVISQRYNDESWEHLVNLWKLYNLHLAHIMDGVSPAVRDQLRTEHTLDKIAFRTVEASVPATLDYLMRDYIEHLKNHLDQIFTRFQSV